MRKFFMILVVFGVLALDGPRLFRKRQWRDLTVFLAIWTVGAILGLGQVFGVEFPNPNTVIEAIFSPLGKFIESF